MAAMHRQTMMEMLETLLDCRDQLKSTVYEDEDTEYLEEFRIIYDNIHKASHTLAGIIQADVEDTK
jgi:hypothetical protein